MNDSLLNLIGLFFLYEKLEGLLHSLKELEDGRMLGEDLTVRLKNLMTVI